MTTMNHPSWVLERCDLRAQAVRRRRCLVLTAVLATVIILGALGL